jgi:hypothetical protein
MDNMRGINNSGGIEPLFNGQKWYRELREAIPPAPGVDHRIIQNPEGLHNQRTLGCRCASAPARQPFVR